MKIVGFRSYQGEFQGKSYSGFYVHLTYDHPDVQGVAVKTVKVPYAALPERPLAVGMEVEMATSRFEGKMETASRVFILDGGSF